jgi:ferredoxin
MDASVMAKRVQVIQKDAVPPWVAGLMAEAALIAPHHGPNGDPQLVPLRSVKELDLDYTHDLLPPTRYLLPPSEVLFRFRNGDDLTLVPEYDDQRRIFFGIRSCDVKGIRYQEQFFRRDFPDIYFLTRLTKAALVSLACTTPPLPTCFCPCCDGGPLLKPGEGYDIQLTPLKGRYLVEVDSETGASLVAKTPELFRDATSADLAEREEMLDEIDQKFSTSAYLSRGISKVTNDAVPEAVWEELADRCIGCGGCSYLCPFCTCFTVSDRSRDGKEGERFRRWDHCILVGFTREASGHNPRDRKCEQFKRRFFHKLSYQYMQREGRPGCVGCGRCLTTCMTAVDMAAVLMRFRELGQRPKWGPPWAAKPKTSP